MGRVDLMQACLVPDGDEEIELEVNDMGECIERIIQPLRFQTSDGNDIPGFDPIRRVLNNQIVDGDICCAAACENTDAVSLLTACATRTETESEPEFTITSDFGPIAGL